MQLVTGISKSAIILCTGAIYYAADVWFLRRYGRGGQDGSGRNCGRNCGRSWGYTAFMVVVVLLLVAQPLLLPGLGLTLKGGWGLAALTAGLLLIVAALALHWWARQHLAQFYVEDVRLLAGHALVDTGPYRWVRHPVFLSFLAIAVGLFLVNPAVTTLLLVVYVVADFWRAARREEALLAAKLPGYEGYMERTGRFWPKWR